MNVVLGALVMIVVDVVWIWAVMIPRYEDMARRIQGGRELSVRLAPAAVAYALMVVGLRVFVLVDGRPFESAGRGALFGTIMYGLYNGTGMAVFRDWTASVAVLDVVWGAALFSTAAVAAHVSSFR